MSDTCSNLKVNFSLGRNYRWYTSISVWFGLINGSTLGSRKHTAYCSHIFPINCSQVHDVVIKKVPSVVSYLSKAIF